MKNGKTAHCVVVIASSEWQVLKRWRGQLKELFSIYEAADRGQLVKTLIKIKPSVLLLDLKLSRLQGMAGVRVIQRLSSVTRIIVLTMQPDEEEGLSFLEAGGYGYCHRDIDPVLLKKAVEVVQKGELWIGRHMMNVLLKKSCLCNGNHKKEPATSIPLKQLTLREDGIATLVAHGASNKEIADRLNIRVTTVKAYLTDIFRKVGVSSRLELAVFVMSERKEESTQSHIGNIPNLR